MGILAQVKSTQTVFPSFGTVDDYFVRYFLLFTACNQLNVCVLVYVFVKPGEEIAEDNYYEIIFRRVNCLQET